MYYSKHRELSVRGVGGSRARSEKPGGPRPTYLTPPSGARFASRQPLLRLTRDRADVYHQCKVRAGEVGGLMSAEKGDPEKFVRRSLPSAMAAVLRVLKPFDPRDRDEDTDMGVKLGRPGSIEARRRRSTRRRLSL